MISIIIRVYQHHRHHSRHHSETILDFDLSSYFGSSLPPFLFALFRRITFNKIFLCEDNMDKFILVVFTFRLSIFFRILPHLKSFEVILLENQFLFRKCIFLHPTSVHFIIIRVMLAIKGAP